MARPLTKDKDGVPYTRPPALEAEIDGALRDGLPVLLHRLRITEREASGYLRSECLVHLVRETLRTGDDGRRDAVLAVLLGRCEAILRAKVSDRLPNATELREEILSEFGELLASDGMSGNPDELDYYECRFNRAFRALRIDVMRRELGQLNRVAPLPDQWDEGEPEDEGEVFARVTEAFIPATQQSTLFLNDLWEAINALPPDERKAVILCHVLGYKEESKFPHEVTAATICKCEGRTIRNRLKRAAAKLSRFKE